MEVEDNFCNFDENQQGNDKENSAANINGPYSNRKNLKTSCDESSNFERNKKLCTWHPPVKNESGSVAIEFSEKHNFCVNTQTDVNSSESTIPAANVKSVSPEISAIHAQLSPEHLQENNKCEQPTYLSGSTIENINDAFDSYQDCDQEIKSFSSLDTLPAEILVDECDDLIYNLNNEKTIPSANKNKKIGLNYDNGYLNDEIEKETVTYENEEHIPEMIENKVKFSNLERMEKLGTNSVSVEEIAMTALNAKDTENKQLQSLSNEKHAKEKLASFYDTNYYSEDKISDGNKFRNIEDSGGPLQNCCIEGGNHSNTINGNVINQQNITQTKKTTIRTETCNDDTFDLTFTNSQLEKLECDETTAVYNNYTNKSNNFWIRKKKEQKEILQKVIKDIDTLNNSIIQATNELRKQFCKNFPK